MLLALLALALPTAALANSISTGPLDFTKSFSNDRNFVSGISTTHPWDFTLVGTNGVTIMLSITHIAAGCGVGTSVNTCSIMGTVTASGPGVPSGFTDSIMNGMITRGVNITSNQQFVQSLTGDLPQTGSTLMIKTLTICTNANPPCANIGTGLRQFIGPNGSGTLNIPVTAVSEPGTLEGLLLGTGVIGLAGMRRKLKLGT